MGMVKPSTEGMAHSRNTLWQGELESWMDENYLRQLWANCTGEQVNVKLPRAQGGASGHAGYAFIEFSTFESAQRHLQQLNGLSIPNSRSTFCLSTAGAQATYGPRPADGPEYSLFVGDLGREVNDYLLFSTFHQRFPTCKTAKVVVDPLTNNSKGYGFVRFSDERECYLCATFARPDFWLANPFFQRHV